MSEYIQLLIGARLEQWWAVFLYWLPYLSVPFVSGVVGWFTNVVALKMTFYPIEYKGFGPIGWQGIIPSKAPKMADMSVDLMTTRLVDVEEIFATLDPEVLTDEMQGSMQQIARQVIDEVMEAQVPHRSLWQGLPQEARERIYAQAEARFPQAMRSLMADMKQDIKHLLNLKALAKDKLMEDKMLINQIFLGVGNEEFRFIERSGFYFGFLFGLLQMGVVMLYNPWWMLPAAGLVVGYLTNYLAIFLIFNPIEPRRVLFWRLQGLFVKRQREVAFEYARIIATRILTVEALFDYLLRGPNPEPVRRLVKKQVDAAVDDSLSPYPQWAQRMLGARRIDVIKNIVHYRFMEELPVAIRDAFAYAHQQLRIEELLATKMAALSAPDFVDFLRPVFKEDEMKLILIGAFLGWLAGLVQYFLFF